MCRSLGDRNLLIMTSQHLLYDPFSSFYRTLKIRLEWQNIKISNFYCFTPIFNKMAKKILRG